MMDTTAKNKILVLGREAVELPKLVDSIINDTETNARAETNSKIQWLIDTRYFNATVEFWIDNTEQLPQTHVEFMREWLKSPTKFDNDNDSEEEEEEVAHSAKEIPIDEAMATLQEHLGDVVDAIVFVFDPLVPESFADILPWARMGRVHQPEVLLCVAQNTHANNNDNSNADNKAESCGDMDRWFEWCVSNGWEWVDLTDSDPDTEYTVGRIRESLMSNQWDTMVVKKKQAEKEENAPAQLDTLAENDVADSDDFRPSGMNGQEVWDSFDSITQQLDAARIDTLHQSLFTEIPLQGQQTNRPDGPTGLDGNGTDDGQDDVSELIARIRSMRSEISQMPDKEQARARAAELAMALARKL
ncbi:hypothetical protein GGF37_000661 [Kickxella alabastrina]|nr:hypothetical protein GGF37_000661 [Kickxella alabastrina]